MARADSEFGILETAGSQALGDGDAEDRSGDEDQDPDRDDSSWRRDGQPSDPLQHRVGPPSGGPTRRTPYPRELISA